MNKVRIATSLILVTLTFGIIADLFIQPLSVYGSSIGDGVLFYGEAGSTTPKFRNYAGDTDTFGAETNTVANAVPDSAAIETSPKKIEAIAAYKNTTNTMQVMCFDGTTWTNEWTATVTNIGDRRPFDIAYETLSGDVVVTYGTGNTASNEIAFRTKAHGSGCGSANWASATNVTLARTSSEIDWVRTVSDPNSDTLGAAFSDQARDATAMIWSGSGWANEPGAALTTTLDFCCSSTDDVEAIDLTFESLSGDLMVAWSEDNGGPSTDYKLCTGGGGSCSWGTTTNISAFTNFNTSLDLSSNPESDEIVLAASLGILSLGYWSGTAWTTTNGADGSGETVVAGGRVVATTWLNNGATKRSLVVYADLDSTNVDFYTGNAGTFTKQTDFNFTPSPGSTVDSQYYRIEQDALNHNRAMLTFNNSPDNDLFAKRVTMDAAGAMTWANSDGGAAIEGSISGAVAGPFDFAYWRAPPTFDQATYRWYANANSVQPGSALAAENTATTITSLSTIVRLRAALTNSGNSLPASNKAFKLQYATSTSGPWSDVGEAPAWCSDSSGITCDTAWQYRRKITFNNSASGTNLTNFPVLVELSTAAGNIDYGKTKDAGEDLRFVDTADPTVVLDHEIEHWNESGTSYVWVNVPQLDSASTTDSILMYYGNAAAADGQNPTGVWDSNFQGVYHMKETTGITIDDVTTNNRNGTKQSATEPNPLATGPVNGAQDFDGSNDNVNIGDNIDLSPGTSMTISGWVNVDAAPAVLGQFISKYNAGTAGEWYIGVNSARQISFVRECGAPGTLSTSLLTLDTWYYVTGVYNGTTLTIYINGVQDKQVTDPCNITNTTVEVVLGAGDNGAGVENVLNGFIDEVRISNTARSADWVEAEYLNSNDAMNTYGAEEAQTSGTWKYYNNATPADGATITTALLSGSPALESYTEGKPTVLNPNIITTNGKGEWDFALDPVNLCSGTYYFRMVESDGTVLSAYTAYPQITIDVAGSVDTHMRHGGFWQNNAEQLYSCIWVGQL